MGGPGLDNVWIMPDGMIHPTFDHELRMHTDFHDFRWTTFRGERYTEFIEQISGISLRQQSIPNDDVQKIADALDLYTITDVDVRRYGFMTYELADLRLMFRRYGEVGATLIGW
jgi:hypothetical protein